MVLVDQVDPKYQEGKPPTAMKKPHLPRIPLMGTNNQGHHQVLHQMALAQSSTSLDHQRSCHILHLTGIPPVHGHFRCCGSDDPCGITLDACSRRGSDISVEDGSQSFFLKGEEELTVGQAFELVARPQSNHFNGQEAVHVHEARCTCVWRNYEDA